MSLGAAIYFFLHPDCATVPVTLPPLLSLSIIGFMVILLAALINDMLIMVVSNLGSLRNFTPRKNIDILLYIGFVIFLGEIGWGVLNTYTVFSPQVATDETNCTSYMMAVRLYKAVVLSYWSIVVFLFCMYAIVMDPCNRCLLSARLRNLEDDIIEVEQARSERKEPNVTNYLIHYKQGVHSNKMSCTVWLRQLCAKRTERQGQISTPREQALSDFTTTFKALFEDINYSFLDIMAGLKLASLYHDKMRENNKDPTDLIKKVYHKINIGVSDSQTIIVEQKTVDVLKAYEDYEPPSDPKELTDSELQMVNITPLVLIFTLVSSSSSCSILVI